MWDTVDMARLIMHRHHLSRHLKLDPLLLKPESPGVAGALDADSVKLNSCLQSGRTRAGIDSPVFEFMIRALFKAFPRAASPLREDLTDDSHQQFCM